MNRPTPITIMCINVEGEGKAMEQQELAQVYGITYWGKNSQLGRETLNIEHFMTIEEAESRVKELAKEDIIMAGNLEIETIEYNPVEVKKLLDGLAKVPSNRWDQSQGYLKDPEGNCQACAFAWAAYYLDTGYSKSDMTWDYEAGWDKVSDILGLGHENTEFVFYYRGASDEPYESDPWDRELYDVFADVFRDRLGFQHG